MSKVLVSVTMITYNHADFIKEAIEGVLMQECNFDFELIISNDNSPDNTNDIINEIIKNHPNASKIKYYNHQKNLGILPNFLYTFEVSAGEYIAICEGDDYWIDKHKLQKQVDFLRQNPTVVFTFHNAQRFVQNTGAFYPYIGLEQFKDKGIIPKQLLFKRGGGTYPTASAMFKKSILENLPNYFYSFGVGDTPLFLLAISKGDIGYQAGSMSVYRTSDVNWSASNEVFSTKMNNYTKKINAYDEYNAYTHKKFDNELQLTTSHLTYQIIFGYYNEEKNKAKRLQFLLAYQNRLTLSDKIKSILRIFK